MQIFLFLLGRLDVGLFKMEFDSDGKHLDLRAIFIFFTNHRNLSEKLIAIGLISYFVLH